MGNSKINFYIIKLIKKNIYKYFFYIIILIFFSCSSEINPYEITGKVTKIVDGDTLKIFNEKNHTLYKVRIAHIDAPEINQNFGLEAKKFLFNRIYNRYVTIKTNKKDKYGRIITDVLYNNNKNNIGEEIIKNGLAWVWHYSNNKNYKIIELNAKNHKLGLWKSKKYIDPFLWRKLKKKKY